MSKVYCVWPATSVEDNQKEEFVSFLNSELQIDGIEYVEMIVTTGGRHDPVFTIPDQHITKVAVPRLLMGIRWLDDAIRIGNGREDYCESDLARLDSYLKSE